jgi:Ca2+-binding EF-hand superfamily protein
MAVIMAQERFSGVDIGLYESTTDDLKKLSKSFGQADSLNELMDLIEEADRQMHLADLQRVRSSDPKLKKARSKALKRLEDRVELASKSVFFSDMFLLK